MNITESDTDISMYSIFDLLNLLDIDSGNVSEDVIIKKASFYIKKFTDEKKPNLVIFFVSVKEKLLEYYKIQQENNNQYNNWVDNEYLMPNNSIQQDKLTNRKDTVDVFNNDQMPMKREIIGVNQNYEIPVVQGQMNPNLKNVTTRIINIDSQFRQNNVPALKNIKYENIPKPVSDSTWSSTQFTVDLTDSLLNVISLKLYSIQIPYTWYNIDYVYGNTCFIIKYNNGINSEELVIKIPPGNYDKQLLVETITNVINNEPTLLSLFSSDIFIEPQTGRVTIKIILLTNPPISNIKIIFYNETLQNCYKGCYNSIKINSSLGWILGFRNFEYNSFTPSGPTPESIGFSTISITGESVINITGPNYFLLAVDDYNVNRLNKGIVNIQNTISTLSLPDYYTPGTTIYTGPNTVEVEQPTCYTDQSLYSGDQAVIDNPVTVPFFTQNLPKTITQAQQYSVNEIIKNRQNNPSNKVCPPSTDNILALIPLKKNNLNFGEIFVDYAGSFSNNIRTYFGPVDIERFGIKLYDDRGNIVNLNGVDWSFSMICESLYQY